MSNAYVGLAGDGRIDLVYRADAPTLPTHVLVPAGVDARDANWLVATFDLEAQSFTVANDAARLQADRAAQWAVVRRTRDAALAACDWTQVADAPLSDATKAAWRASRQALRDLPDGGGGQSDPFSVTWPASP